MCFGGGQTQRAPYNPAPYAVDESYKAVGYTATDNETGKVIADKPMVTKSTQTPEAILTNSAGLNVKGM